MLKIDFGSGYNPFDGYKSCDITGLPGLDYIVDTKTGIISDCHEKSVDVFRLRNVVHHLPRLEDTFRCLGKYLKKGGCLWIIEPRKEFYRQNLIADILWYRYVIPRYEIWFSPVYRDYGAVLRKLGFKRLSLKKQYEKEITVWIKKGEL